MDESKVFRVINRLNAILFLILLLGGVGLVLFFSIQANNFSTRGTVEVPSDPKDKHSPKVELVLGSVHGVHGHETQYVELKSRSRGGKFSSGYNRGTTKNVLFFVGKEGRTNWLFAKHTQLIRRVLPMNKYDSKEEKSETITIFYEIVENDSNDNQKLDDGDLFSIALTKPDGTNYVVLETGISSVVDTTLSKDGSNFAVILQKEGWVYLKNYNPKTLALKNSVRVLEISNEG